MSAITTFIRPDVAPCEDIIHLSTVDMFMPQKYLSSVYCFKLDKSADTSAITSHLQRGLGTALAEAPEFVSELQPAPGNRNELQLFLGPESDVVFRETHEWAGEDFQTLSSTRFPLAQLPNDKLLVPEGDLKTKTGGTRCLAVHATFIPGGLLLTTMVHHTFTDAKAIATFMQLWSRHTSATSQGRLTALEPLEEEAYARWRLAYGAKGMKSGDFPEFKSTPTAHSPAPSIGPTKSVCWRLTSAAIEELQKSMSSASTTATSISKSDAITALLTHHLWKARYGEKYQKTGGDITSLTVYVASDMRSRMEPALSPNYIGNASVITGITFPSEDALNVNGAPTASVLADIATKVQSSVRNFNSAQVRRVIGLYRSQPYWGALVPKLGYFPGPNMLIADISGVPFYELEWGPTLGQIDAYRSIGVSISTGNCSLQPKLRDGTVEVYMHHEKSVIDGMAADKEFRSYAELVW